MWQDSKCLSGMYLHDWIINRQLPDGLEERCFRCGKVMMFRNNTPNDVYLRTHLRMALQPRDKEYHVEYKNN